MAISDIKIRRNDSETEWTPWCREKSSEVLRNLAHLAEVVARLPVGGDREQLESYLHLAIWDTLNLAGFFTGHHLSGEELYRWTDQLRQFGQPAFAMTADELGLDRRAPYREQNELIRELVTESEVCLALPRSEGRTRLHAVLLRVSPNGGTIINSLLKLIESVTMGELSWDAFVAEARPRIEELKLLNHLE